MSRRVIKLGGSLLAWPELPERLWHWLQAHSSGENLLIAGGGELADAIRRYDRVLKLGEAAAHALCIEVLGVSAQLLRVVLQQACERWGELSPGVSVLDVRNYLHSPGQKFPHTWDVTTDSLAALIAVELHADELVLLKSASPEPHWTRAMAAEVGYVDSYFPHAAADMPLVRVVNLRDPLMPSCTWHL